MADDPRPLTRKELFEFLPTQRAVRAFESLFDIIPSDLITLLKGVEEASITANSANSVAQMALKRRSMELDYLDFKGDAPHTGQSRRITWDNADDTLNVHHQDNVVQQVGLETYIRFGNATGSVVANGTVMGLDFTGLPTTDVVPYIADGGTPALNILGVATQDVPNNAPGRLTTFGVVRGVDASGSLYGETWEEGEILYCSATTAGGFTNVKPTAPAWSIPLALVLDSDATEGEIFVRPAIDQSLYFGAFARTTDLTPSAANTAEGVVLDTEVPVNGVTLGSPASRMVVENAGLYAVNTSFQITSGSASLKTIWIWFRINGVDVAQSSIKVSVESNSAIAEPSRSLFFSFTAGDYLEVYWAADSANVTMTADGATAFAPATPACVITVEQIQQ